MIFFPIIFLFSPSLCLHFRFYILSLRFLNRYIYFFSLLLEKTFPSASPQKNRNEKKAKKKKLINK